MKTLDEFLNEIERECCSPYSLTAAKIIREMKEAIDELDIPMSMKITNSHRKYLVFENISKILNGEEG